MRRYVNLGLSICFLLFTSTVFAQEAASSGPQGECATIWSQIEAKSLSLNSMISGVEALLQAKDLAKVPLSTIFEIDLRDQQQVAARRSELAKPRTTSEVLKSVEFNDFIKCASSPDALKLIQALAEKTLQLDDSKRRFLEIEADKRVELLRKYEANLVRKKAESNLDSELARSEKNLADARSGMAKSEIESNAGTGSIREQIAIARNEIEKYQAEIESEQITFLKAVKERNDLISERLTILRSTTSRASAETQPTADRFQKVENIWEASVDGIFELFFEFKTASTHSAPTFAANLIPETEEEEGLIKEYRSIYSAAMLRESESLADRDRLLNELKADNFNLLNDAGQWRADLMRACDQKAGCVRDREFSAHNLRNFWREIRVLPLKFLAGGIAKLLEMRAKVSSGLDGGLDLAKQGLALLLLLSLPILLARILRWVTRRLERLKQYFLSYSIANYQRRTLYATWISRLNPFVSAVGMAFGFYVARKILQTTDFAELSNILFYFQLYFIYRIFRLLLKVGLEIVFSADSLEGIKEKRVLVESSSSRISRLIFIEYAVLYLVQDTVRRALVYHAISTFVFWINIVFIFAEAHRWREYVWVSFAERFGKLHQRLVPQARQKWIQVLVTPFLAVAVVGMEAFRLISSYLIRIDLVKRLVSEVFKRQIESDAEDVHRGAPPDDYTKFFAYLLPADKEIYVHREHAVEDEIESLIHEWRGGTNSDDLAIVVGNRGMGKTTTLDQIFKSVEGKGGHLMSVPAKVLDQKALFNWLSKELGHPIQSLQEFREFDASLTERRILLVDDLQNIFLGVVGGFQAYRIFIELISLKTKNLFWCLAVNSRSWTYLKGVFGAEHFYGKVFVLKPWKDVEIQKLILLRHTASGFDRQFDKTIKAYGAGGDTLGQRAEAQFFRLLWGQSRGNPRSALMYWVSAVSSPEAGKVFVGVPNFMSSSLVSSMSDEALFIFADIARHGNMTHVELQFSTGIADSVIRKCLKEALDKDLIWMDEGERVRISSRSQYMIDYYLIGKNFLYE